MLQGTKPYTEFITVAWQTVKKEGLMLRTSPLHL